MIKLATDVAGFLGLLVIAAVIMITMRGGVEGLVDVARLLARALLW